MLDKGNCGGLSSVEADRRLAIHGANRLPSAPPRSLVATFLAQFLSPLIYILLAAALVSLAISETRDAVFIAIVLLLNGLIGAFQEHSANRAAAALRKLEEPRASVMRDGIRREIDARRLVPGDVVLLEAGSRVPADLRLVAAADLRCDESLLTGESEPVAKLAAGDRPEGGEDRAFAGTMVVRGRGLGVVTATGGQTEFGSIARLVQRPAMTQAPLIIRLKQFARNIAFSVAAAVGALFFIGFLRGMGLDDLFLMSVGLAVSAIPEGLPVAISVALAVGMRRMAAENVIVRSLPAIEALGSCTMIATDKTGTLTMNELTVTEVRLPDGTSVHFEPGGELEDCRVSSPDLDLGTARARGAALLKAAALPNEAILRRGDDGWTGIGDRVDVALLAAARKGGIVHEEVASTYPVIARIPYEPALKYAASFHDRGDRVRIFVKGAPETLIAMADRMAGPDGPVPIDRRALLEQKEALTARGLRVLAFAEGTIERGEDVAYGHAHLERLLFLGLAAMHDPLRPEVPAAIRACRAAGIGIALLTGDDPGTAGAIAAAAGLEFSPDEVATGDAIRLAEGEGEAALDALTRRARIYARIEPAQKLAIILSMARNGHFVAVTGDGVNDAPALKHAHVGVAMGRKGTDIARESAGIVITDDNFASIVAAIRQGRVAYANIRKVVLMVVATGAAEVLLFLLALPFGLPMPLLPVQLLWLNLVTNGVQDVMLAAEKAEGDELSIPPRDPLEPIFDRLMIRRILIGAAVMGIGGFALFWWLIDAGRSETEARNLLLLLFVLFENVQTFSSRSERRSVLSQPLSANPFLVAGVLAAQALHIAAMYMPFIGETLAVSPVSSADWALLIALAAILLLAMEADKWRVRHFGPQGGRLSPAGG